MVKRTCVYIDGYNVYHAMKSLGIDECRKRLNIKQLLTTYYIKDNDLKKIYYFSAYCAWKKIKKQRHKRYVRKLQSTGVIPILGKFKQVYRTFRRAKHPIDSIKPKRFNPPTELTYMTYEEKRTDVSIAIQIVADGLSWVYDEAIIFSSDTDIIPAIHMVKDKMPGIKFGYMYIEDQSKKPSTLLADLCDQCYMIGRDNILHCQFPIDSELP